jgi:transposase
VVRPYARHTNRLNDALRRVALEAGGEGGARIAHWMAAPVSADTLLRRIRNAHPTTPVFPRVLGVDDFAFRRGKKYGTILVDHERRKTIDLLPDREAETLAQWLKEHPGIEIVTRDRSLAYADAINRGAPDAVQIADRWHLVKNLSEALEKLLTREHRSLRDAANPVIEIPNVERSEPAQEKIIEAPIIQATFQGRERKDVVKRREQRIAVYNEVLELKGKGLSHEEIGRRVGKSMRTIQRWTKMSHYREQARHRRSLLDIHFPFLKQRLEEGCQNVTGLWRELVERGYRGSRKSVNNYLHRQEVLRRRSIRHPANDEKPIAPAVKQVQIKTLIPTPSPRKTAWMLLKPDDLEEAQKEMIENLLQLCPEVRAAEGLAKRFLGMVRNRQGERLDGWIDKVKESGIPELKSFADGLNQDRNAVEAALKYEWSNGRTEGSVNRLKLIKRQMYGRGKLDLLKARVMKSA